jgi:hypothetical protein
MHGNVAKSADPYFEQSLGQLKDGENPPHLDDGQPEIADCWSKRCR